MTAFENATKFFDACEAPKGWAGCQAYVADGATFTAQSEPLIEVKTVQAYCDWMYGLATITAPGATYDLHTSAWDEKTRTAIFFATCHAKHTGEGGPVPPTYKETHSHYVYFLTMNSDNKVARMVKVWNAPWAMRELVGFSFSQPLESIQGCSLTTTEFTRCEPQYRCHFLLPIP